MIRMGLLQGGRLPEAPLFFKSNHFFTNMATV